MIYLANSSEQKLGGGWTWINNFKQGMAGYITDDYKAADIYLIPSASMVSRDEVAQAKKDGLTIMLRVDNAIRNSRNRNTGMSRLKDFATMADMVIYQSSWAKGYLHDWLGRPESRIILNGVDLTQFYPIPRTNKQTYLYARINRDETKNWEIARYFFSEISKVQPKAMLLLAGNFSPELVEYNFDFYNDENYRYLGVQQNLADWYRAANYFIYTYFNDACSNSLIEALCSDCIIVGPAYFRHTGGAPEIIKKFESEGRDYFSIKRMCNQYKAALGV